MKLESIEKLRGKLFLYDVKEYRPIIEIVESCLDEIEGEATEKLTLKHAQAFEDCRQGLNELDNDELAEYGLVRLPRDAEGVPWQIGDKNENGRTISGMGLNAHGWYFTGIQNDIDPSIHTHYKPTVEDVLREFAEQWHKTHHDDYDVLITEYAERLQLREDA